MIQTAASMVWQPNTSYNQSFEFSLTSVAASSGSHAVYTGAITSGASNLYSGKTVIVTGFKNTANNGVYVCSASTATTLTLSNASAVIETNAATANIFGSFVIGSAAGTNCLFLLSSGVPPSITGNVSAYLFPGNSSGNVGVFTYVYPKSTSGALASDTTLNSMSFAGSPLSTGAALKWNTVNASGAVTGQTSLFPAYNDNYDLIILGELYIPVAGTYTLNVVHHD